MKSKLLSTVAAASLIAVGSAHAAAIFTPGDTVFGGQSDGTDFVIGVAGTAGDVNNWPGGEPPSAAIDGAGQKYLNFGKVNTGILVTPSFNGGAGSSVSGATFTAANDEEPRDPSGYEILGSNIDIGALNVGDSLALADFSSIASGGLALPSTRNAGGAAVLDPANQQTVTFTAGAAYKSYLILFPDLKTNASANSMQIAEIQLDGTAAAAIPEPSSALLIGLSGLALALRRRRS